MPAKDIGTPVDTALCRRCQEKEVVISIRTEPVCKYCFSKYVQTKIVKRMETFRVKNSEPGKERTLLLPLSFGPSSTALLYVVSRHLKGQIEKTGRTGFKLHVIHVQLPSESGSEEILEQVKQRYPEHTYSNIPLSSITDHESLIPSAFQQTTIQPTQSPDEKLTAILSALPTATSRADATSIFLRKLLVHQALALDCGAILFSDSTTRLSERVLAETAKGRGFSLPWVVSDGESPFGIPLYYPARELLSKEVAAFVDFIEPSMAGVVVRCDTSKPAAAMKNTTIDELTRQYFAGVEVDYPSIVANVVRTTSKLQARTLSEVEMHCELCDMPLEGQAPERSRVCYGCIRTMPQVSA
jgi:cytoplasmic tRNA 2-thiolation protein 2